MIKFKTIETSKSPTVFLNQFAKEHKLVKIGRGAFATVYSKGKLGRVVYKLGVAEIDGWSKPAADRALKDDGYLYYLNNVVLKHQNSPLMPKVYSVEVITLDHPFRRQQVVYIVKMERLMSLFDLPAHTRTNLLWRWGLDMLDDLDGNIKDVVIRDQTGQWKGVADDLKKLFRKQYSDLHEGNAMVRGKGKKMQLVLTDPVC